MATPSITKGDIVDNALKMLGVYGLVIEPEPEDKNYCLFQLELLLTAWNGYGIDVGYQLAADVMTADMSQPAGVLDVHQLTVTSNLAAQVCGYFNKMVPPQLATMSKMWLDRLMIDTPPIVATNTLSPAGAGNNCGCGYDGAFLEESVEYNCDPFDI